MRQPRPTVSCRASPSSYIVKMHGRSSAACPLRQRSQAPSRSLDLVALAPSCTAYRCSASAWVSQAAFTSSAFVGLRLGQSSRSFLFSFRPPLGSVKPQQLPPCTLLPSDSSRFPSDSALYSLTSSRVFIVLRSPQKQERAHCTGKVSGKPH